MPLDARLLATFRVVVHAGRVSAAARLLHLSQPAVTAQVHQLEAQCGRPLLIRSAQGVTPTEAGRVLVGYADRLSGLLDEAADAVGAARDRGGELVLAASTTIAAHLLPSLAAAFLRTTGVMQLRIDAGNTDEIIARVADGEVPLALVEGHSRAPRVRLERFVRDELVPMIGAGAPAELQHLRRAADLVNAPIIWREPGSGTRAVVERALKRSVGRRPRHARDVQIGATEGVKAAALAGLGVAFLSRWSVRNELALGQLRILPLRDLQIPRDFSWVLPSADPGGLAGRFLRFARLHAPQLAPA